VTARFYAPRCEVRISGLTLSSDLTNQVISVSYDNNLDMADMFTLVLRNPDNQLTDSALFGLGKSVEIHMGYGADLQPMMLGEVTALQPAFPESGAPTLTISGYDKSYKLRHNEPDRPPFRYMNDSLIASQIALEAGLIPIVDPSPYFREYLQQTTSDMAFLKELARGCFFDVYVHWDKLYFRFPRPQTEAFVLEWGKNLSSFTPRLNNAGMAGLTVIRGYNEQLAQTVVGFATSLDLDLDDVVEKLGSTALDMLTGLGRRVIHNKPLESPIDAVAFAKATLQDILEGLYEGSGSCVGIPELRADTMVAIRGIGKRFSGMYRLKRVTHTMDGSGYRTAFEVTQRAGSNLLPLLRKTVSESPAPDRQEPNYGVVIGKVKDNSDPLQLGRVTLTFPWFSDNHESAWARCATPMSGPLRGMYFLPDQGDEVLVAFQHGDFKKPVVIGSLWNGQARPPLNNADRQNRIRQIKTKGHTITLDDSPGAEQIEIKDKGGSTIAMASTGAVTISAGGTMTLKSVGDLTINAPNVKVQVQGTMDVS
jgi:phage protein D/phage baseplate assembly protein gpV